MSRYTLLRNDDALPAIWRALDRAVFHWVHIHGGPVLLATVAGWASHADGAGDAALPLLGDDAGRHGMPPLTMEEVDVLRREPLVGDGREKTPFVIDADGRFALWRNHADEGAIAAAVAHRRAAASPEIVASDDLDTLFARTSAEAQRQRDAVAAAAGRRLFVLTGGPGTGKTTTVLRLLLMRLRAATAPLRIRLAAPTGKAAQRLLQALRAGKAALRSGANALPDDWQPLLAQIPEDDASTLHRLLGYDPHRSRFTRHRARPLAADIVVVDEASMLDLAMLRGLLDAVPDTAALILLGDADQLTSVAAGSVLMDLVAALERDDSATAGGSDLVRLEHSFRAQRELARLNEAVRQGDAHAFATALSAAHPSARLRAVVDMPSLRAFARDWAAGLAALPLRPLVPRADLPAAAALPMQASLFDPPSPDPAALALQALRALAQRQLLCALREDAFGALALNALIEAELKQLWGIAPETLWYPGRAVLIARNDYGLRLFNGDVGLCLADADGRLRVWFETATPNGETGARALPPDALPAHDGAFAITVHKSQGSEYAHAAVLLPPDPMHRILSRQLLYTGMSRAKQQLDLCASAESIAAALARPVRRAGGLAAKLRRPPGS